MTVELGWGGNVELTHRVQNWLVVDQFERMMGFGRSAVASFW